MRMRQLRFGAVCVAAIAIVASPSAHAQDYPTKPVTFITPAAAGNSPDVVTRVVADRLTQIWKQQIVVLNRPGAGGLIAAQAAAAVEKDRVQPVRGASLDIHRPADRAGRQNAGESADRFRSDRHGG
jgi:tripartite-type tricarboxylate transporter receptor subunit TctC